MPAFKRQLSIDDDFLAHARARLRSPKMTLDQLRSRYRAEDRFLAFCSLLKIKIKDAGGEGTVALVPTEIQLQYCRVRTSRDIICKARQVKITTIELARDVWFFVTKKGVNVRVVCQSSSDDDMLRELSGRIRLMLSSLQESAGITLPFESESTTSWELPGGSTLKILSAGASDAAADKKGRGGTIHRLHTTELAVWEYASTTLNAMREAIPGPEHGSEVVHESTPNGTATDDIEAADVVSGGPLFHMLYKKARSGINIFKAHFFNWMGEPEYALALEPGEVVSPETQPSERRAERERQIVQLGATPEQLKWYRRKVDEIGQNIVDQEYPSDDETCFLVSGRAFFDAEVTQRMLAQCLPPINEDGMRQIGVDGMIRRSGAHGTLRIWQAPEAGKTYVIPADTSEGTGGNRGGCQVYERGTGQHVATLIGQFKPPELATELARIGYLYNTALLAVERNNHGHAVLQELLRVGPLKEVYPNVFHDADKKPGWNTTPVSRPAALDALEQAHRTGQWATPDKEVVSEIRTFIIDKKGKATASAGSQDDLVMMAAIGWNILCQSLQSIIAQPELPANEASRWGESSGSRWGDATGF